MWHDRLGHQPIDPRQANVTIFHPTVSLQGTWTKNNWNPQEGPMLSLHRSLCGRRKTKHPFYSMQWMETAGLSSPINICSPALMSTSQKKYEWPPQAEYIYTNEWGIVQGEKNKNKSKWSQCKNHVDSSQSFNISLFYNLTVKITQD